jgi:hypothetical protein
MSEDLRTRANRLKQLTEAMRSAWPVLWPVLQEMRDDKTQALIAAENPETRGFIKAVVALIELPESVKAELEQLAQTLEDLPE